MLLIALILVLCILLIPNTKCDCKNKHDDNIKNLTRQAARWSLASQQDESPLISLLHANYGAGYLWALKDIASDKEIKNVTNIDILKFKQKITDAQDEATMKVTKACPQFIGDVDTYLAKVAGNT